MLVSSECVPRHIIYFLADGGLYGPRGRLRRGGHGTKTGRDQRCAKACNGDEHSKRPAASAAVQAKVIVSVQVSLCSTNRRINENCLFGKAYTRINNCKVPYEAFMVKLLCYDAMHENQFIHLHLGGMMRNTLFVWAWKMPVGNTPCHNQVIVTGPRFLNTDQRATEPEPPSLTHAGSDHVFIPKS